MPPRWSADHLRLHRSLLLQPRLLPRGASLLLAVSGGQDSMAMTGLLMDLQPHHRWRLHLWHGDHGWRPESSRQALELQTWARQRQLPMQVDRQDPPGESEHREASARRWRYLCLRSEALRVGCSHVLTAHTASDRAETVLLNLARGSHRRGLASLRRRLPLEALLEDQDAGADVPAPLRSGALETEGAAPGEGVLWLVRPLQLFSREDTLRLCRRHRWPTWIDPTNAMSTLSRNRIRARVLPVLEELHPGAARRISQQAERLAAEQDQQQELLELALAPLLLAPSGLDRRALVRLSPVSQGLLLQHWLVRARGRGIDSRSLASLLPRLAMERGSGQMDLSGGWQLSWQGSTLALLTSRNLSSGHG
ncbi:MAG: tRNA lysidine(34) synthetase TilS [Cyanobium sp.]